MRLKLGLGLFCAVLALPMNPQSPRAWCEDTCLVLDMDYVGTYGCDCVCKDVDGAVHSEPVPDCP